ncbi:hypothetical protein [Flavobacterium sp.]
MHKYLLCLFLFSSTIIAQKIYKTPSGKKYHLGSCRMAENVSQEITLEQASQLGLAPCKICKPQEYSNLRFKTNNNAHGQTSTVQCRGKIKKGTRCKHQTSIANGYCFQHNPNK